MAQKPLLFFPSKDTANRSALHGGGDKHFSPSSERQGERLSPQFRVLSGVLAAKRAKIQQSVSGIDPEQVLVFEIIGSVDDFVKAVYTISGLEWLGELEIEDIAPDDDFYAINKKGDKEDKQLSGRLYLVLTNIEAMTQLLSLWNIYVQYPTIKFDKGKAKFKDVFKLLKNIRKWDIADRFEETNILKYWEQDLQIDSSRVVKFELELWYRANDTQRQQSYRSVSQEISNAGGRVITSCDIPDICYHSILAELPAAEIQNIISNRNTELVKCENIMYFRPSGQIIVGESSTQESQSLNDQNQAQLPLGEPIVAILDGYPLARHNVLENRLIIDDPDNMETHYQVDDRKHGTAMCSLIVKGDLNDNDVFLPTPLYVRPIMRPSSFDGREFIPNDSLLIDTIHRAVRRMFEDDGSQLAVAQNIKIINLSLGDPDRLFYNSMSPWSKLLDWLSYKYKVLFIVSTGNHSHHIELTITRAQFNSLTQIEKEKLVINEILKNRRNSRLMSPAESINSITVGALHADNAVLHPNDPRIDPYLSILPSTYTAFGGGYRRMIKPDLVYIGGRQMFDYSLNNQSRLSPSNYKRPPGLSVAAPDSTLNKTIHETGTSNSAALMSRNSCFCYEILQELIRDNNVEIGEDKIAIIIKAMLAHGCSWGQVGLDMETRLNPQNYRDIQKTKSQWIGYGYPNINKVKECTEQRATVIGFGELKEEEAHVYSLPLPPSLASKRITRRLTITLAWFSPISANTQKYRTSKLWFEAKNQIVTDRKDADWQAVKRGTLQHEVFEGSDAAAFIDGDTIKVKINCSKDASSFANSVAYAVIVSLEVAEGIDLQIYQEIKDRIIIPIPVSQII